MHEPSPNDCGCCADVHFGALLNQSARVIRRALDARISGVNPDLSGVRGMVLGDIVRANRNGRDVYQRDIEQWFNIRRSSVTALLQGMEQDGFITRCAVEKDARLKRLVATDKGRALPHTACSPTKTRYGRQRFLPNCHRHGTAR